jgi:hypothetical protein
MQKTTCKITIFFDNPFWVGVYERVADGKLEVCKMTFGAEPKDYEVYDFLLKNWDSLHFSSPIQADDRQEVKINPKRMQRAIKKQLDIQGVGTKAQQALKEQHAEGKAVRKKQSREEKEAEKQLKFEIRQQKRKDKHKGK